MGFYDDPNNVEKYIGMCEGYDGSNLYKALAKQLPAESTLLELGSGAGFDIEHLKLRYRVTGSDFSDEFLRICRDKHPDINFLKIDANKIKSETNYDCIYSNKVLHHLTEAELKESLAQQSGILVSGGIVAHSFWLGEENHVMEGLLFTYYRVELLKSIISESFEIMSTLKYKEIKQGDSIFIVARLKDKNPS